MIGDKSRGLVEPFPDLADARNADRRLDVRDGVVEIRADAIENAALGLARHRGYLPALVISLASTCSSGRAFQVTPSRTP
jgi:hypothetical protein